LRDSQQEKRQLEITKDPRKGKQDFWKNYFDQRAVEEGPPHRRVGYRSSANAIFLRETLHRLIGPITNRTVLDAGAGDGQISETLSKENFVVCSDLSEEMLKRVRLKSQRAVLSDMASLPFANNTFDVVICVEALQCVSDPAAVVGELARVIRPQQRLILTASSKDSLLRNLNRLLFPPRFKYWPALVSSRDTAAILSKLGMKVKRLIHVTYYLRLLSEQRGNAWDTLRRYLATNFIIEAIKAETAGEKNSAPRERQGR
jgi:ubiquinone/menaquinone biosynthesis C-methylase UbiE